MITIIFCVVCMVAIDFMDDLTFDCTSAFFESLMLVSTR